MTPELQGLERRILEQDSTLDVGPRRLIQKKAVLVADPGDPIELARLPQAQRESLLDTANSELQSVIEAEPGGAILHAGTASYGVFDSIGAAVSAAETITLRVESPGVRIAIDFGDVELSDHAVSGAPVSRAAVLVAVAHRGQALLSLDAQQALVLGGDGTGLRFESLGRFELVGIKDPVSIHQLLVGDPPTSFPPLDTSRVPPALPEGGDRSLPGYELREAIGPGSIGTLYRAYQPSVGREVMVEMIGRSQSSALDFIREFEADAQRLALLDHPNINPLVDYWRDTEGAFLVYRYHRGGSLVSETPPDPDRLLAQVASALDYAHSCGVLHGSVRPDRIVLDESGNGYLMGFPIAGIVAPSLPRHASYLAPECLAGEPPSVATDVFALGVLAHELTTAAASADDTAAPESRVVGRAVSEDPRDRYATVADFLDELSPARPALETRFTVTRNPYKGLSAFQESDVGDFHGRAQVVEELIDSLGSSRFLAVVGPSGIGKSSVVRAGLIPALRRGAIAGSRGPRLRGDDMRAGMT